MYRFFWFSKALTCFSYQQLSPDLSWICVLFPNSISQFHSFHDRDSWQIFYIHLNTNFSWDQKKVIDRESSLIPRKLNETIHSLKNPNHINKISYASWNMAS